MSLTVTYSCCLSLTVYPNAMDLAHASHCLLWLLAVFNCLFQFHEVAACLSLTIPVPWS